MSQAHTSKRVLKEVHEFSNRRQENVMNGHYEGNHLVFPAWGMMFLVVKGVMAMLPMLSPEKLLPQAAVEHQAEGSKSSAAEKVHRGAGFGNGGKYLSGKVDLARRTLPIPKTRV